jgi:cellulose synthase/poly-beta-1,6-N-acetylglucosamine synthase-like glycosyltransferase
VPGAVGAWRRELVERLGGFHSDTLAEDADLTIRVIRAGYRVTYEDRAIALTEAPATVASFVKQRFRWTYGMMQVALKHFDALSKSKMNAIGWVALPNILVFQLLLPCIAPVADVLFVVAIGGAVFDMMVYPDLEASGGLTHIFMFYALFFTVDLFVAVLAFLRERGEQWWMLILLVPQRFFHRQLLYYVVLRAILVAIRGRAVSWYKVQRMATVKFQRVPAAAMNAEEIGNS